MRIISQNGEYDIPYERVAINVYDSVWSGLGIAKYSNEAKAEKAMEMCRNNSESTYFQFPRDEVML